jgi:hypothetical protein
LEEHTASIFRVEEQDEQDSSVKAGGFLLSLFFAPEDGDIFLQNIS